MFAYQKGAIFGECGMFVDVHMQYCSAKNDFVVLAVGCAATHFSLASTMHLGDGTQVSRVSWNVTTARKECNGTTRT